VAAICAAALALDRFGVLENRRYTCYPGVEARIESGDHVDGPVVEDGLLLTSQGPGTAMAFALTLLERLRGRAVRDQVALGLLFTD
jgi:4-methyl-5(b-hydroxyethyl)-thiazole monophosphate biosynthesis